MLPKKLYLHIFIWFWVVLSFVLLSSFLILRASGFAINFKAKTLEKTGLIVISSDPRGALLYLNGKFKEKTPAKLTYLKSGLYHLKVEKEGYQSWEKTERVEAGKFIDEEVVLFLAKPEIEEASVFELEKVAKKEEVVLNEGILKDIPKEIYDLAWHKNKKILLYRTDYEIWLYCLDKPEKERNKIIARFSKNVRKAVFYPDFGHILFVIDGELRVIEISGANDTRILDLPSSDFWVSSLGEILYKEGDKVKKARVK